MCCIYISWPNLGFGHFIPDLLFQVSLVSSRTYFDCFFKKALKRILKNFEGNDLMLADWSTYVTDKEYMMFENLIFHGASKFQEFDAKSVILRKKVCKYLFEFFKNCKKNSIFRLKNFVQTQKIVLESVFLSMENSEFTQV